MKPNGGASVLVKYSPDGIEQWRQSPRVDSQAVFAGSINQIEIGIGPDGGQTIYVGIEYRGSVVKFDTAGNMLGENRVESYSSFAVDDVGNVYVIGSFRSTDNLEDVGTDILTSKFSSEGELLWSSRFNGAENWHDRPVAIKVDAQGNTYVAGESNVDTNSIDAAIIKYDPDGNELWMSASSLVDSPTRGRVLGMGFDEVGNILVGGKIGSFLQVLKYSPEGAEMLSARGPSLDARDMLIDMSGNVYFCGATTFGGDGASDFGIVGASSEGRFSRFSNEYNGPGNGADTAQRLSINSAGELFVVGSSAGRRDQDIAILKLSSSEPRE